MNKRMMCLSLVFAFVFAMSSTAFAKRDADAPAPAGWSQGEKTGWGEGTVPPGQATPAEEPTV